MSTSCRDPGSDPERSGHHQRAGLRVIGRHVLDLTVTSVPWPQYDDSGMRGVARVTNVVYAVLLPTIIAASLLVFPRRNPTSRGPRLVLAHLLCVLPTVVVFVSEPRYRLPYDVFGLALLAALTARLIRVRVDQPGRFRILRAAGSGI